MMIVTVMMTMTMTMTMINWLGTDLFDVIHTLDHIGSLQLLLDMVRFTEDGQVLVQGKVNQCSGQLGQVSQIPQKLKNLGKEKMIQR